MTQPTSIGGRPVMPALGMPVEELRIVRFRRHGRRLVWPALILIAVAGVTGYFWGNLPEPWRVWMLFAAAGVLVLFLVLLPYLSWWAHTYTVTTRRIIEQRGLLRRHRTELLHVRGYDIHVRRGILQRIWGAGTLTLSDGVDAPMTVRDVPSVNLVHEALVDQVEVSQILAHRDAAATPFAPPAP